ncbi:CoA-transferase [Streptomyces sp. NPDC087420]|uniref:CoA-transferase n=1 Tax=Streptomyces sp. NPDC087420 TaxID=3365785 RepID=UPI00383908C8
MERAASGAAAVAGIAHGSAVAIGGEDADTLPWALVDAVREAGLTGLHVVCSEAVLLSGPVRTLLASGGVARLTCAGDGGRAGDLTGEITVRWLPPTDLNERLEAADASIAAFLAPVGPDDDDPSQPSQPSRGRAKYRREEALRCDAALIRAVRVDSAGNLVLDSGPAGTDARMAKAGGLTLVQTSAMDKRPLHSSEVDVPGIHVDRVLPAHASR